LAKIKAKCASNCMNRILRKIWLCSFSLKEIGD
jgi:hypothetical protein